MEDIDKILEVLNSAFEADENAVHCVICNRVPCNEKLSNHPDVVVVQNKVLPNESSQCAVGALGLINGIVHKLTGQRIAIAFTEDKEPKCLGFIKI